MKRSSYLMLMAVLAMIMSNTAKHEVLTILAALWAVFLMAGSVYFLFSKDDSKV